MRLRFIFLALFCVGVGSTLQAQDTIRLKNGTVYVAEVMEVGDDFFLFKKANWDGKDSLLRASLSSIASIRYKSGYEEVFSTEAEQPKLDRVMLKNAVEWEGQILEVGEGTILFRRPLMTADSLRTLSLDSIAMITYSNGYREKYNEVVIRTVSGAAVQAGQRADTIRLVSGKALAGFVSEIEDDYVAFAKSGGAGPAIERIPKASISRVIYANGYTESYNQEEETGSTAAVASAAENKQQEAAPKKGKEKKVKDKPSAAPVIVRKTFNDFTPEALRALPVTYGLTRIGSGDKIQSLDLSGQGLLALDEKVFTLQDLVKINLNKNKLKELPARLFMLPNLYQVSANDGLLKEIGSLPKQTDSMPLAHLSLANNKLGSVDEELFLLPNLRTLNLRQNELKSLGNPGKKAIMNDRLRTIDLSYNRLRDLPKVLSRLTALSSLDVSNNQIKQVDLQPYQSINLEYLNLANNPLTGLGPELYGVRSLRYLNLSGTLVKELTDSISKLSELTHLYLSDKIKALPGGLRNHPKLRELTMENNLNVVTFPSAILSLSRLEVLSLNGTKVRQVPDEIGKLRRLRILSLSNSGITTIPTSLFELPRLQRVDLSANRITSIPGPLGSLEQLELLNLESSPVDQESLLRLKKSLPYAAIKYYSPELGLNYESRPVAQEYQTQFVNLLTQCEKGNTAACYELGRFFENSGDFGLAFKIYYRIAEELTKEGSAQHAIAYFKVAELFNDADNKRSYNSIYKSRSYSDYSDYKTNIRNNRALGLYCKLCEEKPEDQNAYKTMQQACAKASLIYNELQKNLKKLYDYNRSEVERLVGGAGTMGNVSAAGEYVLNTSTTEAEAVTGGLISLIGTVGKSAKESKAERIQKETLELKAEIERLRGLEEYFINLKK
jgi:Leucine-rich repeat (LRR) protein